MEIKLQRRNRDETCLDWKCVADFPPGLVNPLTRFTLGFEYLRQSQRGSNKPSNRVLSSSYIKTKKLAVGAPAQFNVALFRAGLLLDCCINTGCRRHAPQRHLRSPRRGVPRIAS